MLQLIVFCLFLSFCLSGHAQASFGKIEGRVMDAKTGQPVIFANVVLEKDGIEISGEATDMDGCFLFRKIPASSGYVLKVKYVGYEDFRMTSIIVKAVAITDVNVEMVSTSKKERLTPLACSPTKKEIQSSGL